jgi:hypothetical protein
MPFPERLQILFAHKNTIWAKAHELDATTQKSLNHSILTLKISAFVCPKSMKAKLNLQQILIFFNQWQVSKRNYYYLPINTLWTMKYIKTFMLKLQQEYFFKKDGVLWTLQILHRKRNRFRPSSTDPLVLDNRHLGSDSSRFPSHSSWDCRTDDR